jgi:two-component sensor histidine kinase
LLTRKAVATSARTGVLQNTIERMKVLVEEKDRLLEQKKVLAEELQHRVRNNLQLVYGMLSKQADGSVALTRDSDAVVLDLDVVTALGIVVAEVVTNSYDHAFPDGKRGSIVVSVRRAEGDMATVTISDDGTGFPARAESKRHGLGLVRRLVEQVRGSATINSDHGTVWTIRIPLECPAFAALTGPHDAARLPS